MVLVVPAHHRVHARHGLPGHRPESTHTRPTDDSRPPTVNEIRRLYDRIVLAPARTARTWLAMHWHRWRTRHQTRARTSHYRTRTARAHSP